MAKAAMPRPMTGSVHQVAAASVVGHMPIQDRPYLGFAHIEKYRCRQPAAVPGHLYQSATRYLQQALVLFHAMGNRGGEAEILIRLGKARERHATALRLASEADAPRELARAHRGLARACQAGGDPVQARHHWQEALTHYTTIGAPEADQIRACLATAGAPDPATVRRAARGPETPSAGTSG